MVVIVQGACVDVGGESKMQPRQSNRRSSDTDSSALRPLPVPFQKYIISENRKHSRIKIPVSGLPEHCAQAISESDQFDAFEIEGGHNICRG